MEGVIPKNWQGFCFFINQLNIFRNTEMIRNQENHINYEKWAELTAKDIFIYEDEKPRSLVRLYDMFDGDFDEEEPSSSKKK